MHDYDKTVNSLSDTAITPRQIVCQIVMAEAERVNCHIDNRPTNDVDRLLQELRAAATDGEHIVEIGGVR